MYIESMYPGHLQNLIVDNPHLLPYLLQARECKDPFYWKNKTRQGSFNKHADIYILIGVESLDYYSLLIENIQSHAVKRIILVEWRRDKIVAFLANKDSESIILNSQVETCFISETLASQGLHRLAENYYKFSIEILFHSECSAVAKALGIKLKNNLYVYREIDKEITTTMGLRVWKNIFYNTYRKSLGKLMSVSSFFCNRPAIICGGGPSLKLHLSQLKKMQNQAVLFSSGSASQVLSNANISPHFIASRDPSKIEKERYEQHNFFQQALMYQFRCYHKSLALHQGPLLYVQESAEYNPFIQLFIQKHKNLLARCLNGIFTSCILVESAYYLQCSPIILLGFDFASKEEFNKMESPIKQCFYASDNNHFTSLELTYGKEWFEDYGNKHSQTFIQIEGGLSPIESMPVYSWKELHRHITCRPIDYEALVHGVIRQMPDFYHDSRLKLFKKIRAEGLLWIETLQCKGLKTGKSKLGVKKNIWDYFFYKNFIFPFDEFMRKGTNKVKDENFFNLRSIHEERLKALLLYSQYLLNLLPIA